MEIKSAQRETESAIVQCKKRIDIRASKVSDVSSPCRVVMKVITADVH